MVLFEHKLVCQTFAVMSFRHWLKENQKTSSSRPLCTTNRKSISFRVSVIILRTVICFTCLSGQIASAAGQNEASNRWTTTDISSRVNGLGVSDRLQGRRRQSPATLLSHKQNLITGSANTPLTSPYNQFYLTNSVNSPHNGK